MSAQSPAPQGAGAVEAAHSDLAHSDLAIYVSRHCEVCRYAYEVARQIRQDYPQVRVRLVELETTQEQIPEAVFATPTYLLNGRVWSLGNPSVEHIQATFQALRR